MSLERAKSNAYMTLEQHYTSIVIRHLRQLQECLMKSTSTFSKSSSSSRGSIIQVDWAQSTVVILRRQDLEHSILQFMSSLQMSISQDYQEDITKFTNSSANHLRFLQRVNETTTHNKPLPVLSFPKRFQCSSFFLSLISSINHFI